MCKGGINIVEMVQTNFKKDQNKIKWILFA
jgi:hypothetical protein